MITPYYKADAGLPRNSVNVNVCQWSACSPDMNPAEYLWDHWQVRRRPASPVNRQDLKQCLVETWQRIPTKGVRRQWCGDVYWPALMHEMDILKKAVTNTFVLTMTM